MDQDLQRGSASSSTREVVAYTLSTTSRIFLFRNVYLNGGITVLFHSVIDLVKNIC